MSTKGEQLFTTTTLYQAPSILVVSMTSSKWTLPVQPTIKLYGKYFTPAYEETLYYKLIGVVEHKG